MNIQSNWALLKIGEHITKVELIWADFKEDPNLKGVEAQLRIF